MCVILHMSVITQRGESALMMAAMMGETEVVVELVKAGANVDMQNKVCMLYIYTYSCVHVYVTTGMYKYLGKREQAHLVVQLV